MQGLYILANDTVIEWTIAFLNSFRFYNPHTPICVIPFDDNIEETDKLKTKYNFFWYENEEVLEKCDRFWLLFYSKPGKMTGTFRKLACWFGLFESFIYSDIDVVILQNLQPLVEIVPQYGCLAGARDSEFVWKESIRENLPSGLTKKEIEYSINTGFFTSNKWSFDWCYNLESLESMMLQASKFKGYMKLEVWEQPILNYMVTRKVDECVFWWDTEIVKYTRACFWPRGEWLLKHEKNSILLESPRYMYIHWAGNKRGSQPMQDVWDFYRYIDLDLVRAALQKLSPNSKDSLSRQDEATNTTANFQQFVNLNFDFITEPLKAEHHLKLADLWQSKGKIERAILGYQEALRLKKDYLVAYVKLGNLMQQQGRLSEAVSIYHRLVEMALSLGIIYY